MICKKGGSGTLRRLRQALSRSNGEVRLDETTCDEFTADSMCRFVRISRSAYYAWLQRGQTTGEKDDAELTDIIQNVLKKSR